MSVESASDDSVREESLLVLWCQRALPEDTRPFELLVARYKQRVFGVAYRLMDDRQDAEDQAQEAFVKIYQGIKKLDNPATLQAWIYRITINTCLDALNTRRRRPMTVSLAVTEEHAAAVELATTLTPEVAALHHELQECLKRTLHELPPPERVILVLRDLEGRAYQEIAESLTLGLSAVKMRIHRARLAFQQALGRVCPDAWRAG